MRNLINELNIRLPEPRFAQEPDKSWWPAAQREQEGNRTQDDKEATEQIDFHLLFQTVLIISESTSTV